MGLVDGGRGGKSGRNFACTYSMERFAGIRGRGIGAGVQVDRRQLRIWH